MAPQKQSPIDDDIDGLFQLPLPEFTEARNALAAKLKKAGRRDDAATVKALQKPPASAWAINQLRWRHPQELDDLLMAGDRFREAQRAQLEGKRADLRKTLEAWRQALNKMTKRGGEVLKRAGHQPTPELTRRISTTLETLATYGSLPDAPAAGRLTADLDPPGFEALAALVPRGGSSERSTVPPRVLPFAQKKSRASKGRKAPAARPDDPEAVKRQREAEIAAQRVAARKALETAQQGLRDARRTAQKAEAALKKVAARAKLAEQGKASAEQQRDEAEKRFEKASNDATEATREARRVAREAEEAAQALSDAERDLERARTAVEAASEQT